MEGGVAAKVRALYAALFTEPPPEADSAAAGGDGADSGTADANGSSAPHTSSAKLAPSITAAKGLLSQVAGDAIGQLAQLTALEWLLTVCRAEGWALVVLLITVLQLAMVADCVLRRARPCTAFSSFVGVEGGGVGSLLAS